MIKTFLASLYVLFFTYCHAQQNQPVANPSSVIISGNARFTLLTSQLVRLEWSENGKFEDFASFVVINRNLPKPSYKKTENAKSLTITTDALTIRYRKQSGPFTAENLSVELKVDGKVKIWKPGMSDPENLKGTARTLDGARGGLYGNGTPVDLGQGLVSRSGWMLLDDSKSFLLDGSEWNWVQPRPSQNIQDWYFFGHGHNYKQALLDYTKVAGKIPMVPKYALGYWWSRYWVYSDQELKDLVNDFKSFDIPIDVLVIDMDWHDTFGGLQNTKNPKLDETGEWLGWTGYTWNRALFPDPKKFLAWTNEQNLKTALNLHPASGIAPMEEAYNSFAKTFQFDTTGRHYIPFQMDNKKWARTYFDELLQPMEKQGVDFWWLDWQQYPESKFTKGLSNTWWLNYTFFTDMEQRGVKRPLLFHRWGGMGNHRYQIGFSGDDRIDWGSLKYQTYFTSTAANVGYGYWSHDIGGHAATEFSGDAELYVRWLQFGVFSPILRTHSAKISTIERRFWKYPDHFKTMKDLINLRYTLAPYIYNASRQAYDDGVSICKPMYYDYPNQEEAYQFKYQYMFGDDMLVAPVSDSVSSATMLTNQKLWLPEGKWYEWHSGTVLGGGKVIARNFALDEIPLYVKAGSIIPMYPKVPNLQEPISDWVLSFVPGKSGSTTIYEDDGTTNEYSKGKFGTTKVKSEINGSRTTITIFPLEGAFEDMQDARTYELRLMRTFPAKTINVNGVDYPFSEDKKPGTWKYDGLSLSNIISIPSTSVKATLNIEIIYDEKYIGKEEILSQKILSFRRLSAIMGKMKIEVARKSWWSTMPDEVLAAEQTPTKIQYNPADILEVLKSYDANYSKTKELLLKHPDARPDVALKYVEYLKYE